MGHPGIGHMRHPRQQGRIRSQAAAQGVEAVCGKCGKRVDVLHHDGIPLHATEANRNLEAGDDGTLIRRDPSAVLRCRSRCGARYTIKLRRLKAATERALEAGAPSVVLGVDV